MHVSALFLYPVKSLRGCAVPAVELDELGFAGDRRFMVIDASGQMLTQRQNTRMALVDTALAVDTLTLASAGHGSVTLPRAAPAAASTRPTRHIVSVWKSEGLQADDCGDKPAAWLSQVLGTPCRLVRIGDAFRRPVLKAAATPVDRFSFADGSPVLVVSEASLADLNDRIQENHGEPVPMDRFRPNLVVAGCEPFAEDSWPRLHAGTVVLRNAGKSDRCIVTTTDQRTGSRGKEPLRTLATFRRDPAADPTAVFFGTNYINESKRGALRVGDVLQTA